MSAFIIFYSGIQKHIDELMTGISEELGFPALRAGSFKEFLALLGSERVVAAILDLSAVATSPKTSTLQPSESISFRAWAATSPLPVLILSDDADLAENEPLVTWSSFSGDMATMLAPLVAPIRQVHRSGLDIDSSQVLMGNSAQTEEIAKQSLDIRTSAVVSSSLSESLCILVVGEFPKIVALLQRKFSKVIHASTLEDVRRCLKSARPQAILISQEFDRFECALDTLRLSEVTRHTSIAILGDGSTYAPTLSRAPTLLFQQNTPPAYVVEQLSFGARVALLQTPRLMLIAEDNAKVPELRRLDGGVVLRCSPQEITSVRGSVDLIVLAQSTYETTDARKILGSVRERFGVGTPILLYGEDESEWSEWVDGVLNPKNSTEDHSRTIDVFAAFSRARTQISERDDLTGANHWCGFRHALNRRLIGASETRSNLSILGVEIERFSEILSKHNSMHDTILRYVSDHLWQYFPKPATFRGPEGRFFVLCDPISESNFRKIERHLDSIRSTTLRDPNGHGLYLRLHAAHLRVPPGILSSQICIDAIMRMFSRMRVHSGATFLSAELDPELVDAPPEQQGES